MSEGFECGILLEGFNDVKEGDVLEAYETREIERTEVDECADSPAPPSKPTSGLDPLWVRLLRQLVHVGALEARDDDL